MRPTIKRIAELAGVSKTAVSFAFNDPSKIARSTYERIMEIAEREGYVPDPVARTMTSKRVGAIGVLLPQAIQDTFRNPYVSEVLRGVGTVCHQEDLFLTILPPVKGFLSQAVRNAVVDGFIALGVEAAPEIATLIRQRNVPFVTIDGDADSGITNVGIDDAFAAETIMNYVLSLGHQDIIILSLKSNGPGTAEEHSSRTVDRRLAGFERALQNQGLSLHSPSIRLVPVDVTMESAEEALIPLLSHKIPTAIVSMSDSAAFGAYMALVPVIQPPIIKALTSKRERRIVMTDPKPVSKRIKIIFPIATTIVTSLLVPAAAPLLGMLMIGNLFRESGVVDRLSKTAQNELINIVTILLGISVGSKMSAEAFLNVQTLFIIVLGVLAFGVGTAGGVMLGKLMCWPSGWGPLEG